jgi:hypothetical protein
MQHEPGYRLQPPVDQATFVRCTKILGSIIAGRFSSPCATQGVASNPFNFFCFHPDFGWTGATGGP